MKRKQNTLIFSFLFIFLTGLVWPFPVFSEGPTVTNPGKSLTPVILIPGMSRTKLVRKDDGHVIWGNFRKFFAFHDTDELALPIDSTDLNQNQHALIPHGLMDKITIVPYLVSLYSHQKFLERMKRQGYRLGDIESPKEGDTFFIFLYDWRKSHQINALELSKRIEQIKKVSKNPDLKFDIIAHCSATYMARYYALYGDENVLNEENPVPTNAGSKNIRKLILVSPPHRGTMIAFQILHEGFKPVRLPFTMFYSPYEAFTAPAFFEMLPQEDHPFIDQNGNLLNIDLFEPQNWIKYKWSVFSPKEQNRLTGQLKKSYPDTWREELKKENEKRFRYLQTVLKQAKTFHEAINEETKTISPSVKIYSFIFKGGPTLRRAEFGRDGQLRFRGEDHYELRYAEGDLMITDLSMYGRYKEHKPTEFVLNGRHRQMANSQILHHHLIDIIQH